MAMTIKHRSAVQHDSGKCNEMWYRIEAQNVSHNEGGGGKDNNESPLLLLLLSPFLFLLDNVTVAVGAMTVGDLYVQNVVEEANE